MERYESAKWMVCSGMKCPAAKMIGCLTGLSSGNLRRTVFVGEMG
jgi:hypothetical protein